MIKLRFFIIWFLGVLVLGVIIFFAKGAILGNHIAPVFYIALLILFFFLLIQSFFQWKILHKIFPSENKEFYRFITVTTFFMAPVCFLIFLVILTSQFLNLN